MKQEMSDEFSKTIKKDIVRSFNQLLNQKIEEMTRILVSFIETTNAISVKNLRVKFIQEISGNVFMLGILNDLFYTPKGVFNDRDAQLA